MIVTFDALRESLSVIRELWFKSLYIWDSKVHIPHHSYQCTSTVVPLIPIPYSLTFLSNLDLEIKSPSFKIDVVKFLPIRKITFPELYQYRLAFRSVVLTLVYRQDRFHLNDPDDSSGLQTISCSDSVNRNPAFWKWFCITLFHPSNSLQTPSFVNPRFSRKKSLPVNLQACQQVIRYSNSGFFKIWPLGMSQLKEESPSNAQCKALNCGIKSSIWALIYSWL